MMDFILLGLRFSELLEILCGVCAILVILY